jgi:hypothetical protein
MKRSMDQFEGENMRKMMKENLYFLGAFPPLSHIKLK